MDQKEKQPVTHCARCGTCCMKGGPALHDEDSSLVETGQIPLASLYTIRQGELTHDNVSGGLIRAESEIIKIKSIPGSHVCIYYKESLHACRIYENRPLECRVLECWDTGRIIQIYDQHRLVRQKLLSAIPWVSELIETHEARCSFEEIHRLVSLREKGDPQGAEGLQALVNDDAHLRYMLIQKGNIIPDMIDFLLGRPLSETIPLQFGIKIKQALPD
jgi:Fe-S-cluster containining protein